MKLTTYEERQLQRMNAWGKADMKRLAAHAWTSHKVRIDHAAARRMLEEWRSYNPEAVDYLDLAKAKDLAP